jgi:hypothetical protein
MPVGMVTVVFAWLRLMARALSAGTVRLPREMSAQSLIPAGDPYQGLW